MAEDKSRTGWPPALIAYIERLDEAGLSEAARALLVEHFSKRLQEGAFAELDQKETPVLVGADAMRIMIELTAGLLDEFVPGS